MLIALISDIHANLPAFEAVLKEIDSIKPDFILCLGDVVGYGPSPNEVIQVLRERDITSLMGNHDAAIVGLYDMRSFREPNYTVIGKTREIILDEHKNWLASLPLTLEGTNWIAAHASPLKQEEWPYLNSSLKCMDVLEKTSQDFCFVGHTHRPGVISNQFGILKVQKGYRYVINPGAVGQSRDMDKRACFCTINTETFEHKLYRVSYEFGDTLRLYPSMGISRETGKKLLHLDRVF